MRKMITRALALGLMAAMAGPVAAPALAHESIWGSRCVCRYWPMSLPSGPSNATEWNNDLSDRST